MTKILIKQRARSFQEVQYYKVCMAQFEKKMQVTFNNLLQCMTTQDSNLPPSKND